MKQLISPAFLFLVFQVAAQDAHNENTDTATKTISQTLLEQTLSKTDLKNNLVRLETVIFPPLYTSKMHRHPCPLFVYVLEGELVSEFEGVKKLYKAGECFYEKKNGIHSVTQNPDSTYSTKILVIYIMKKGMETFVPLK